MPLRRRAAALLASFTTMGAAASGLFRLEGQVLDADGRPAPSALVELRRDGAAERRPRTDEGGRFVAPSLAPGAWTVTVHAPGHAPRTLTVPVGTGPGAPEPLVIRLERDTVRAVDAEVVTILGRGDTAYRQERWADARLEYQKVLALKPEMSVTLHELVARCFSREGNHKAAVEHLEHVRRADPTNARLQMLAGQQMLRAGMVEDGLRLLEQVPEEAVTDAAVYIDIGRILMEQERTKDALAWLTRAIDKDPGSADAYFERGLAHLKLEQLAECRADLARVLELAPEGPQAPVVRKALEQLR